MDKEMFKITEKTAKYRTEIQQMMFVSGETGDIPNDTTTLIEQIVQQQVVEMLTRATTLANRAGLRSISIDHLIFNIRHDKAKVSRLQSFLSWKDVRKNVKDSDDRANGGGGGADDIPDDMLGAAGGAGPAGGGGPAPAQEAASKLASKHKKAKVRLPWDVGSFYTVTLPEAEDDEGDEDEEEMNLATLQRLHNADERTKHMTREEYVHFSECRQASFTYRKGKRFREWAGFGVVTDSKPNDDVVDILGFLTFEIVQTLTEEALKIKAEEDAVLKLRGGGNNGNSSNGSNGKSNSSILNSSITTSNDMASSASAATDGNDSATTGMKRKGVFGLFDPPEEERTPIQPKHIMEAFRRSQEPNARDRALQRLAGGRMIRRPLKFI